MSVSVGTPIVAPRQPTKPSVTFLCMVQYVVAYVVFVITSEAAATVAVTLSVSGKKGTRHLDALRTCNQNEIDWYSRFVTGFICYGLFRFSFFSCSLVFAFPSFFLYASIWFDTANIGCVFDYRWEETKKVLCLNCCLLLGVKWHHDMLPTLRLHTQTCGNICQHILRCFADFRYGILLLSCCCNNTILKITFKSFVKFSLFETHEFYLFWLVTRGFVFS